VGFIASELFILQKNKQKISSLFSAPHSVILSFFEQKILILNLSSVFFSETEGILTVV
jgi:hypothetical protein